MEAFGMIGGGQNYALQGQSEAYGKQMMTMATRLSLAVAEAEKRLADAKRAKEIFEKNPDLEELLSIMQRMHF